MQLWRVVAGRKYVYCCLLKYRRDSIKIPDLSEPFEASEW